MRRNLIKIGQALRLLQVSRPTLWRWEKQGLVRPLKNRSGIRFYTAEQIEKLRSMCEPK